MRNTLLSLVLLTTLAGCTKNEIENTRTTSDVISFSTINNKLTRAANVASDNYRVYAKSSDINATDWFINTEFNGTTDKPKDGLTFYWPMSPVKLSFWAYAPATSPNATVTANHDAGTLSMNYTVPNAADEDLTVATPVTNASASSGSTVRLAFAHMLSKVTIVGDLTQALKDVGYSISFTSADLNVSATGGTMDVTNPAAGWKSPVAGSKTYGGKTSYMFLPQASTGVSVQLKGVTISRGGITLLDKQDMKVYRIAAGDITGNVFAPGAHYRLTLTVNSTSTDNNGNPVFGDAITFSASMEADWKSTDIGLPIFTDNILYFKNDGTLAVGRWGLPGGPTTQHELAFFKFGSVIGFRNESTDWNNNEIVFNPTNMVVGTDIADYAGIPGYTAADYANYDNAAATDKWRYFVSGPAYHTATNIALGKGDPCKLAGLTIGEIQAGTIDNGTWRLPTRDEQATFSGFSATSTSYSAHWGNASDGFSGRTSYAGGWFPKGEESSRTAFLPAGGYRAVSGNSLSIGTWGGYWTSVPSDDWVIPNYTYAYYLAFGSSYILFNSNLPFYIGSSVRCVPQ